MTKVNVFVCCKIVPIFCVTVSEVIPHSHSSIQIVSFAPSHTQLNTTLRYIYVCVKSVDLTRVLKVQQSLKHTQEKHTAKSHYLVLERHVYTYLTSSLGFSSAYDVKIQRLDLLPPAANRCLSPFLFVVCYVKFYFFTSRQLIQM